MPEQWDGGFKEVTDARVPVYFVIGDHDEYYGPEPFENAYQKLYRRYQKDKVPEQKIHSLIRLDVKPASYFSEGGVSNQHGGGGQLFCRDRRIMNWLFSH